MRRSGGWKNVPESTQNLIAFSDAVSHVIDSEPISHFIAKVSSTVHGYDYVIYMCIYKSVLL